MSITNLANLQTFYKTVVSKPVNIELHQRADCAKYVLRMYTDVELSLHELVSNERVPIEKLKELRDTILSSNLFIDERKALEEYEKLKNMKFVIDGLKELDLTGLRPEYEGLSEL